MSPRKIAILGSTGSIGQSAIKVLKQYPDRFDLVALSGGENIKLLADQIRTFRPALVSTRTESGVDQLRKELGDSSTSLVWGVDGAMKVASHPEVETVLSAIVGAAGLPPTLAAVKEGKTVALANKESLVVAGALVSRTAAETGARLLPVDSEHNAIFQALAGAPAAQVRRLILTASGGPFFLDPERDLTEVQPEDALRHPNWSMGEKITIDSATMMNKGLEIIEAHWLFGFAPTQIDAVVHPQSIVHSMVEFVDGSVVAQMGVPDMRGPIGFALAFPDRLDGTVARLDFAKLRELTFFEPDHERFPAIGLARKALESGETAPAVLNGANEVTVQAYLAKKIGFLDISRINGEVLAHYQPTPASSLEDYLAADRWGREKAETFIQP